MAERPPLPVEILTIIVWLICVDCLDVVLLSKDLADHDAQMVSTTFTSLLRLSYAARNVTLEALSKTLGISIDNSSSLPRLFEKPWVRLEFFRAEIYDKHSYPRTWLQYPPTQLPVVSTYVGLATIWRHMGGNSWPQYFYLWLPELQMWDEHARIAWPECPNVFRAALRDRVTDAHGRIVLMEHCLRDISELDRSELTVLLQCGEGTPGSGSGNGYGEQVSRLLSSLSKVQKDIVTVREALAGFPPSVPLADLMHHRCRSFLCEHLLDVIQLQGTEEPVVRCREVARELLNIFAPGHEGEQA